MEFRLDEAQVGLQETVARFCVDRFPFDSIAAREGAPLDRALWRDLAALGVQSLMLGEDRGGSGLGPLEGAIVFEQLGEHLVEGPLLWSVLAAPLVDGAADGEVVVGGVSVGGGPGGGGPVGGVAADSAVDGVAIVEHGADLDVVLVVRDHSVEQYHRAELPEPVPLEPLDPLTPVVQMSGLVGGAVVGDESVARGLRDLGTVLVAAASSGIAARSLEVARSYALERQQFDAPIGSFQAVKHLLADMYVRAGLAQSSVYAAAAVLQEPGDDDPAAAAAAAKVVASDAAITNASTAVQVLGGMGFTWDMLPNHLLKRAWVLEHTFGTGEHHAEQLGAALVEANR